MMGPSRSESRVFLLMLAVGVLLVGCAAGTNLIRPPAGYLIPGQTTYDSVIATYGKPWVSGKTVMNGRSLEAVTFAYARLGAAAHAPDIEPARGIFLWFENKILVGHEFRSSFENDHTDFDGSLRDGIVEGETNEAGVKRLLGPPNGEYIQPMVEEGNSKALVYSYMQTNPWAGGQGATMLKRLVVQLDQAGLVSKVDYSIGESK